MVTSLYISAGVASHASVTVGTVNVGDAGHSIVVGPGSAPITGGVLSSTFIVWAAVLVFPHQSVAVHVRVTAYSWGQAPGVVTSLKVSTGEGSMRSVAVGVANIGVFGHSITVGPGKAEITGAARSTTIVMAFDVAGFPEGQDMFDVRIHLTISPFAGVYVYVLLFGPAFTPLTCH